MGSSKETVAHLRAENEELRRRLEEADQTLEAIRSGEVDALIVSGAEGEQVFTLKGADYAYRSLVENMSEGAATLDAEGIILYCNKRLAEMLQMPLEQMVTSPFRPLVSPPDYRVFDALFQRAGIAGSKGELNLITANGSSIPVNLSMNVLKLEEKTVTVVIATDLTQQKVMGEMVAAEQLSISITEQANEAILVCDENGQVIRASAVASHLCGADPLFKQFEDMFHIGVIDSNSGTSHGTGAESPLRFNDLMKGGGIGRRECTLTCADNRKLSLLISAGPLRDSNSRTIGSVIILTDITELRKTVEALRESEEQYQMLANNVKDAIWLMDMELKFLWFSPSSEKLRGFTAEEMKAMPLDKHLTPESFQRAMDQFEKIMEHERQGNLSPDRSYIAELEYFRRDGSTFWAETNMKFLRNEKGEATSMLFEGWDITERKQAAEKLVSLHQQNELILGTVTEGIIELDLQGNHVYVNPAAAKMLGYEVEELLRRPSHSTWHHTRPNGSPYPQEECAIYAAYRDGLLHHVDTEMFWRKDGASFPVEYASTPIYEHGRLVGAVVTFMDITERRLSNEKLLKSYESLKKTLDDAINTMAKIVETRDPYTSGHQHKVADLAIAIAREMKLEDTRIDQIRMAAVIHDIGKLYIPSDILSKPGRLSEIEFSLIKTHAQSGYDIVKGMDFPCNVAKTILQHHERLDGSGYPNQLKGEDTLLEAKILAVADVIEAMAAHRPYRPALGIDKALEEISKNKGRLYDPDVVDTSLKLFSSGKFEFKSI